MDLDIIEDSWSVNWLSTRLSQKKQLTVDWICSTQGNHPSSVPIHDYCLSQIL